MILSATLSDDMIYRYSLTRWWATGKRVCFIMLNPSTADERKNDATIRRLIGYAKRWGYGGFIVVNLFALRSTEPRELYNASDPVGRWNDMFIRDAALASDLIVCAWGNHGYFVQRDQLVKRMLLDRGHRLHVLKLTSTDQPSHPLRLPANLKPRRWE